MATGGVKNFDERRAYTKIVLRLTQCVAKVLRRVLIKYVSHFRQTLDVFLFNRRKAVLKDFAGQINEFVLFPVNKKPTDIETWDICLLVYVLSTVCTRLPSTILKAIPNVRVLRNQLVHSSCPILKRSEYDSFSNTLSTFRNEALNYVSDHLFTKEIEKEVADIEDENCVFDDCKAIVGQLQQWCKLDPVMTAKIDELKKGRYR